MQNLSRVEVEATRSGQPKVGKEARLENEGTDE